MTQLIKARAVRLSRRSSAGEQAQEFLVLVLAGNLYGVPLTSVREILSPPPITPVPRAPRGVLGVCTVRGLLITVIDLRQKLALEQPPLTRRARVLLTATGAGEVVGALVDQVENVIRLSETEIENLGGPLGGTGPEAILGIGRPAGSFVVLLDLTSVVSGAQA